jgi:SAM-dependent methyltransferase
VYRPTLKDFSIRISNRLAGGLPIPRPRYITNVAGAPDVAHFLASGRDSLQAIKEILERNGVDPAAPGDVLDFGCGSGRILRHWEPNNRLRLHGTDYNSHLIAWCSRNFGFADFRVNPLEGPLPYPDASFDVVYAWSVFTHLSKAIEDRLVVELARVLRPRGVLVATFHGDFYLPWLAPEELERYRAGDVIVHRGNESGTNACASFHDRRAVSTTFGPVFDVRDFSAGKPPLREQDIYLLQKR